ncbi:oligosaccharide flippase family protein [Catellatospora sp. NPDC049609]|uniref:oligosaccharide flippase family protein n=1 Tax=Catellatospora sp. NPDC049609 TaxID=3155505 RepID=UPI003421E798
MSASAVDEKDGADGRPATGAVRRHAAPPAGGRLRRTAVSVGLLGLSQVGVTLAAFGTQIVLARTLPQVEFGFLMTVLSLISLTAPLAVAGVPELWLQVFGREGAAAFRWVRRSLWLVLGGTAVLAAVLVGWGVLEGVQTTHGSVRIMLASVVLSQAAASCAASALQLQGRYSAVAILQFLPHVGRISVVLLAWWLDLSLFGVALGYAATALVAVVPCLVVLRPFWTGRTRLEGHGLVRAGGAPPQAWRALVAAASPFMLGNVFYLVGMNGGTVVIGEFLSPEAAALMAVPMSVLAAVYLIPRVVFQQFLLGKLHRWSSSDNEAVLMAYRFGSTGMLAFGTVIAVLVGAVGWFGIPVVFGGEYQESVAVMAVLAAAIPLRFAGAGVASLLTTGGLLRRKVVYQGIGAGIYVVGLIVTLPLYGMLGGAIATVVAEAALFGMFWQEVVRNVVAGAPVPSWAQIRKRLTRDG